MPRNLTEESLKDRGLKVLYDGIQNILMNTGMRTKLVQSLKPDTIRMELEGSNIDEILIQKRTDIIYGEEMVQRAPRYNFSYILYGDVSADAQELRARTQFLPVKRRIENLLVSGVLLLMSLSFFLWGYFVEAPFHIVSTLFALGGILLVFGLVGLKIALASRRILGFRWVGGQIADVLNQDDEIKASLKRVGEPNIDMHIDLQPTPRTHVKMRGPSRSFTFLEEILPSEDCLMAYDRIAKHVREMMVR